MPGFVPNFVKLFKGETTMASKSDLSLAIPAEEVKEREAGQ
jgi:hypothetical protein